MKQLTEGDLGAEIEELTRGAVVSEAKGINASRLTQSPRRSRGD